MKRAYRGGYHCGALRFEVDLDLGRGHAQVQLQLLRQVAVLDRASGAA